MVDSMVDSIKLLPKGSTQGDALLACLCGHLQYKQVMNIFTKRGAHHSNKRYTRGKYKMMSLCSGAELRKPKQSTANYERRSVEKAVDFILSGDNIQILSWGKKSEYEWTVNHSS